MFAVSRGAALVGSDSAARVGGGGRRAVKPASVKAMRGVRAAAQGIETEVRIDQAPMTLLREGADEAGDDSNMRARFERMIRAAQDEICNAISELDGKPFHEDAWTRPGGGGGISRVLQDGNVFEKAGVNVSVVYGQMPPEAYRAATGEAGESKEMIPFFAAGISSVMHPHNPMAPTVHFNYRYFETDAPKGAAGAPRAWWFGGGTDLTPSYIFDEDVSYFHQTLKDVCDKHDEAFYPKFKQWADDYFMIKHRGERRGVGGVFFDDMNDRSKDELLAFATDMAGAVVPAYVPLVAKHKDDKFTAEERAWQQMRRGRYVEFNLVYDRGTTFGLKTGGRIESILMSLPRHCEWQYDHSPAPGSREEDALDAFKNPRTRDTARVRPRRRRNFHARDRLSARELGQTDTHKHGGFTHGDPERGASFAFELRKQIPSELVLKNTTKEKQAFKVKTTAPKKYCVKPNTGIVEPGASLTVTVMMQAHREVPADFEACKDKFLVQATPSGGSTDMAELFARGNENIKETKLRVAYVKSKKPSTVLEEALPPPPANESPAEERLRLQKEVGLLQSRNRALVNDLNMMQKRGGKIVRGFTLLHILLTAILAFILGRYL